MDVGIHLPVGDLNIPRIKIQRPDQMISMPDIKPEHIHHHHHSGRHDEENQYNSAQMNMRIQRWAWFVETLDLSLSGNY